MSGKGIIGPTHGDGRMETIWQTSNQIRILTPPNADDLDLLAAERMAGMKDGNKSRRGLGRTGSVLWVFRFSETELCKKH